MFGKYLVPMFMFYFFKPVKGMDELVAIKPDKKDIHGER